MAGGFRTVGHSNRSLEEFCRMLHEAGVQIVADVRSFPRSRRNPVFNIDSLPDDLRPYQIGFRHFPDLGGRRTMQPGVPDDTNALWRNRSFHNYADYALSDRFADALASLVALGRERTLAIMCSEAVWWRCHRRIITDYLIFAGFEVRHLMGNGREDTATPTPGALPRSDGRVIYPTTSHDPLPSLADTRG